MAAPHPGMAAAAQHRHGRARYEYGRHPLQPHPAIGLEPRPLHRHRRPLRCRGGAHGRCVANLASGTRSDGDVPANDLAEACALIAAERNLSPREAEVLALLAEGHSRTFIMEKLVISDATVKSHTNHIYQNSASIQSKTSSRWFGSDRGSRKHRRQRSKIGELTGGRAISLRKKNSAAFKWLGNHERSALTAKLRLRCNTPPGKTPAISSN